MNLKHHILSLLRQATLHGFRGKRKNSQLDRLGQSQQGRLKQSILNKVDPEKKKASPSKTDLMQKAKKKNQNTLSSWQFLWNRDKGPRDFPYVFIITGKVTALEPVYDPTFVDHGVFVLGGDQ